MNAMRDLTGQRFGKLTAISPVRERDSAGRSKVRWLVRCDCGAEKTVRSGDLVAGDVRSCGCALVENVTNLKHGAASGQKTPEYRAWTNLKDRCLNPRHRFYSYYGGRGIGVAPVFADSFPAFLAEIGPRPTPLHSVDRIENDRGYEPGNVRWATAKEQANNRRPAKRQG